MQHKIYYLLFVLLFTSTTGYTQSTSKNQARAITIQPGIGMRLNFGKDLIVSNLVITNPYNHLSIAAHSSVSYNNMLHRNFNYIKTNYDYSISQSVGAGTTIFGKRITHSFLLMLGLKYSNFKQTLQNPEFEQVASKVSALSPDMGFRYNFAYGTKKYFFHTGLYLPLYPYPFKSKNIEAIDGNLKSITLEAGVGIRISNNKTNS